MHVLTRLYRTGSVTRFNHSERKVTAARKEERRVWESGAERRLLVVAVERLEQRLSAALTHSEEDSLTDGVPT